MNFKLMVFSSIGPLIVNFPRLQGMLTWNSKTSPKVWALLVGEE